MSDPTKKTCGQCGVGHPATNEFFGTDKQQPDSLRRICKECYSDNRYGDRTKAVQALRVHDKLVAKAKRELVDNLANLSPGQIEKYERIVRLAPEHRAELQGTILETRKAEEDAQREAAAAPSLTLVQKRFGSPILLTIDEMRASLEKARVALGNLTGHDDGLAVEHVEAYIKRVAWMIADHDEREAEKAAYDQEVIDGRACQDAADAVRGKFAALFGEGVGTASKDQLKAQFQIYRAEAQQQNKNINPGDRTATGASCKKIAQRILEELTAIASRLGKAGTEVGPQQSLENVQSFEWQQHTNAQSMRAYVRQLTAKLEEARTTMTPQEYEKKYLQLPVAPKEEIIIWKVRLLNGREEWIWPSGKIVRRGVDIGHAEIVKDAVHGWVISPSPVGAELDDEAKPVGKLECVQEDNGNFVYKVVDPNERWEQGNDGLWKKMSGSDSPWSRPEPITFKVGPAQPDAAHSEFRLGNWFTPAECIAAEQGPMLDQPPVMLPPLTRTKADSVALPPPMTAEEIAKESREPNRWRRHEERERFRKEQEAALLRGKFVWNFESAAKA